jgi:hypothetical protein
MWDNWLQGTEGDRRPRFEIASEYFEYHWYEHPGIGRVEVKRKRVNQP